MTPTPEVRERIRRYLLGQLTDDAREQVEQDLLANEELFEELLVVEDEIIDEFLAGNLNVEERANFEGYFLATSERHEKLRFGRAFDRYLSSQAESTSVRELKPSRTAWSWTQAFYSSPVRLAACAMVLLVIALGVWRIFFYQSEVDKALLALNAAYREQRPVEARISKLEYAPYLTTRGPGTDKVDQKELRRAELTLLDALNKNPTPAVHHALGKVYLTKKQFDDAIREFNEALKSDPKNAQLDSDLGAALMEKGKIDRAGPEPGKGLEDFARSLEKLNKALELDKNVGEALFNRALCHQYMMLQRQAEDDWREYLKKDSTSPWADEARRSLESLKQASPKTSAQLLQDFLDSYHARDDGKAWRVLSQTREMISGRMIVFQLTREFLDADQQGRKEQANLIASVLAYAGELEKLKASDPYVSELANYYSSSSRDERIRLVGARAQATDGYRLYLQSNYSEALKHFIDARNSFNAARDIWENKLADYWIANCDEQIDKLDESENLLDSLASFSHQHNYKWLLSQTLWLQGQRVYLIGEYSKAIEYDSQALKLSEEIGDAYNGQKLLTILSAEYRQLDQPLKALAYQERSLNLAQTDAASPRQTWRTLSEASQTFYLLSHYEAAAAYAREALYLATNEIKDTSLLHLSHLHLGQIYAGLADYQNAFQQIELSFRVAQALNDDPISKRLNAYSTLQLANVNRQSGKWQEALASYDRVIKLYDQMEFDVDKYAAHKGRLLCYLAARDDASTENELPVVLEIFEKHRARILEEQNRNSFFDHEQNVYDLAIAYEWEKGRYERAFDYSETSRARSLLDTLRGGAKSTDAADDLGAVFSLVTQPSPLATLQSRIPEAVQVVQYAVLNDRVLIWLITRTRFEFFETPITREQLQAEELDYVKLMAERGRSDEEIRRLGVKLYKLLISPVAKALDPSKQVCIVPDKILFQLPFATLVSGQTGRYLLSEYPLFLSPSLNALVLCSESAAKRFNSTEESLLSVGNPAFDRGAYPNLPDLPAAALEARTIAAGYRKAVALTGGAAVKEAIETRMANADVIHLACHYLADEASPMRSSLILAQKSAVAKSSSSRALSAYEVLALNLQRPRLVVLSACKSGVERYYEGEGMIGMARTFIASGVPLVVATQWFVDSDATAELMIRFHQYRRQRLSTVEALRRAQLDFIEGADEHYRGPYYWAGFLPIGGYAEF